jgi:hypothetical protein
MMYLYTEFPNFDSNRVLWYFLKAYRQSELIFVLY